MKKAILALVIVLLLAGGFFSWRFYSWIFLPNTPASLENAIVLVPQGSTVNSLVDSLTSSALISNAKSFKWVARRMSFDDTRVKTGRYAVDPHMSNRDLITRLRLGEQKPVDLVVTPTLTFNRMANRIAGQLMLDSASLVEYVRDTFLVSQKQFSDTNLVSLFIPNTYEVFWNTSPSALTSRMLREYTRFWNNSRLQAAERIGLNPDEVYTLASIVERETHVPEERPIVAGLYLNRLKRNMALQADPTVLFANGDFGIRRVLYKHLEVDSPYNTYKYPGLPPGPISMASISSIDAVLNPRAHNFYYMCAKPGANGHVFAETLSQHNRNAREYQRWLTRSGIR